MNRTVKVSGLVTAAMATVFICAKTRKIQKKARAEGRHVPYGPYEAVLKRPLDVLVVAAALPVLVPVMGITALAVRAKLGSPVLFRQERPGKDEKIFTLYKFRTMTDERDKDGELLSDEERLTGFGKWLRSTSLDELPEVVNILKGDMSLVGPRPLLVEYLPYYSKTERCRHELRPGLTGLAQTNGRNSLDWTDRFGFDVEYVKRVSFISDIRIMLRTIKKVMLKDGILVNTAKAESNFAAERKAERDGGRETEIQTLF